MGVRADLLATAEGLAAEAKRLTQDGAIHTSDGAIALTAAAKTALEAAALSENVTGGEIDEALGQIQDLLADAGLMDQVTALEPVEFLKATYRSLLAWRQAALDAESYLHAYDRLRELNEGLLRDFTAADTETSKRIAARIQIALDDCDQTIKNGGNDGQAS